MEQQRKLEKKGKRPIALPITLVLLVFSLIGNVFLYSLHLQNTQNEKYDEGLVIFKAAEGTVLYFQEMNAKAEALLQGNGLKERIAVQYDSGAASAKGAEVIALMEKAAAYKPEQFAEVEAVQRYLDGINDTLTGIGSYEGSLTENDRAQLEKLIVDLKEKEGIAASFNLDIVNYKTSVIRIAAGYGWLEMTEKLYASFLK